MIRTRRTALAAGLLVAAACSGPAPQRGAPPVPPPAATVPPAVAPLVVGVVAAEGSGAEGEAWATELREAVRARAGDLRLAAEGATPDVVVRIEKVQRGVTVKPEPPGEGETEVVHGTFVAGGRNRPFVLAYRGEARPQTEALARNLRSITKDMAAPTPEASPKPAASR